MLHGAARFKAKGPGINLTIMEMALVFAPQGSTIEALRIWSEEDALADALSRLCQGAAIPQELAKAPRSQARDAECRIPGRTPAPPKRQEAAELQVVCE